MKLHQQGNEIIVTEFNPISEVPNGVEVFMFLVDYDGFKYFDIASLNCLLNEKSNVIGWLPMPQYRPEATQIEPECFRKGVKALFDYLHDRVANNYHANSDQMSELQKMNKVFEDWLSDALQEVSEDDYNEWLDIHAAYAAGAEKYKRSHELYEKLRKLNPRQFSELFEAHLNGDVSFDELVAKLP